MKRFGLIPYSGRYRRKIYSENKDQIHGKVLDVGAGGDSLSASYDYLPRIKEYIAIDVVEGDLDVRADGAKLPFCDGIFDTIIISDVLEHVKPQKVTSMIEEAYRVLKSGGKVLITTPFLFHMHQEPNDYQRFTELGLREILKEGAFKDVHTERVGTYTEHMMELLFVPFRNVTIFLSARYLGWLFLPIHILGVILGNISRWVLESVYGEHPWDQKYYLLNFAIGAKHG